MRVCKLILSAFLLLPITMLADEPLKGTPIGTKAGYNYEKGQSENDIQYRAFDGDLNTYFATYDRSRTWVGLDLGEPHVITRVGWSPRNDSHGEQRVQLGVIQGANSADFMDAVPLYLIPEKGKIGEISYADVNCTKGFRYVRFVSANDARCNIAELEFYGTPGKGNDNYYYQVTNLPTVVVNTVDAQEPYDKEHDITANIIMINDNKLNVDNKAGTIRERGNGSRQFPKKPWRLKFDKKQNVLDAPAKVKKWTLLNNYGDKTLMRNLVAFEIARRIGMNWVPWGRAVDVILNGEYRGCYQLCDQVEVNPGRVEITEMDESCTSGEDLTGGYLFEIDAYASQEPDGCWFTTPKNNMPITMKSPDFGIKEQLNYIKDYFNNILVSLFSTSFCDARYDYRTNFDVPSFIKHFMTNELVGNTDTYWSVYMYKDRNDPVVHTGPAWDFDLGFDNDWRTYPIHSHAGDYLYCWSGSSGCSGMKEMANRILKSDPRSFKDIQRIWSIARNDADLTPESLKEYIDNWAEAINASQKLNFVRWPIMNQKVHENPMLWGSYEAEVQHIKDYIDERIADLDKLYSYDKTISGIQNVTNDIENEVIVDGNVISLTSPDVNFSVYNISGVKVFEGAGTTGPLASGLYIVSLENSSYKVSIK